MSKDNGSISSNQNSDVELRHGLTRAIPRTQVSTTLKQRILSQALHLSQEKPLHILIKPFIFDWRWLSLEMTSACAIGVFGFYLGGMLVTDLSTDAWIEESITSMNNADNEETDLEGEWTL